MKMIRSALLTGFLFAIFVTNSLVRGDEMVTQDEMSLKDAWVKQTLLSPDHPVASFVYNGIPSGEFISGWSRTPTETHSLPVGRTQYVMKWTDLTTGLELRIVGVDYSDYPAVEWTAYLKNNGSAPTPILEKVRGIDSSFANTTDQSMLRTIRGDFFSASSYEPLEFKLGPEEQRFQPVGGRPTNGEWPYFNMDYGQSGVLLALGWPGQWQAGFSRQKDVVRVWGGQETTHLQLQPGEEIRTPLVAVLFWKGSDWLFGQNLWRHWFIADNMPRLKGERIPPLSFLGSPTLHGSAAAGEKHLDIYLNKGPKLDYFWIDAGWYEGDEWFAAKGVGTWTPDPIRYPGGIRAVSDYVHAHGMKLVLWFEPERVYRGSFLWDNHPEWLLKWNGDDGVKKELKLLNLGIPAARQWLTDRISHFITDQGVDVYRQDFNLDPLVMWQQNDTPDRQGMTENLYVQGYLAYWDGLLQQHPDILIDSCASGGRRNDLETLRRGTPFLRSDYQAPNLPGSPSEMSADVFDGNQGHTYGLSLWVPIFGTGEYADDEYSARSQFCPLMVVGTHMDDPDWDAYRRQMSDHEQAGPYFYGDYYPLTPYSKATDVWIAWEFFKPDQGDGMVQAFRRELSPSTDTHLQLRGLKPDATYEFTDLDTRKTERFAGKGLMEGGLRVHATSPRTALILTFKEVR